MMNQFIVIALLFSLILFPVIAMVDQRSSSLLYGGVFFLLILNVWQGSKETYDNMDFFPWNEVNIVRKRNREDTVVDCAWRLDQKDNDNIFHIDDPVLSHYSNSS